MTALISGSRHDPRGYDFRAELLGSKDSVAIGLDARTPLRSLEPEAPPPPDPYTGFLDRFDVAFKAEMTTFLDVAGGRLENPCPPGESRAALAVAIACERSLAEGRPVQVER